MELGLQYIEQAPRRDFRGPNIIYFVDGLPDVTERIMYGRYEEVIFNEAPEEALDRLVNVYLDASSRVLHAGHLPCFTTVAPMSLEDWNTTRMNVHKVTSHLIHHRQYPTMQYLLNQTISSLNYKIMDINTSNNMETPHLAGLIMSGRGANSSQECRVRYHHLEDGCHPHLYIIEKWQRTLSEVAFANRVNLDHFIS